MRRAHIFIQQQIRNLHDALIPEPQDIAVLNMILIEAMEEVIRVPIITLSGVFEEPAAPLFFQGIKTARSHGVMIDAPKFERPAPLQVAPDR